MARVRFSRPLFRRHYEFVAVRAIRLTSAEVIQPGTELSTDQFPTYQLRSLYHRRRIGVKGAPWTMAMLDQLGDARARPEVAVPRDLVQSHDAVSVDAGLLEDVLVASEELVLVPEAQDHEAVSADGGSLEAVLAGSGENEGPGDEIEVVEGEKGWRTIMLNGEEAAKVRGEAGVQAWLEENGYATD